MRVKEMFFAVLGALLLALPSARAATANTSTSAAATDTNANVNLNNTMASLFGDPVIAKGKGFEIKQSQLDDLMTNIKSAAAARGQVIPPERLNLVKIGMLDRLIDLQLLLQKATAADKAEGKKAFEKSLQELKASQHLTDAEFDQKLGAQLQLQNMTRKKWNQQNIDQATSIAVLKRELNIAVTPAEAKTFYDAHPAYFERPEMAQARDILLLTIDPATRQPLSDDQKTAKHKQILDLLKRAHAGADFAKLASEYSEDPSSKNDGGELPPFSRGQTRPEIESAVFALATNQISDVVTTPYGYYIFKLLKRFPAKTVPYTGLDTKLASNPNLTINNALSSQAIQAGAPKYLMGLRKDAGVQILEPELKKLQSQADAMAETNVPPSAQ